MSIPILYGSGNERNGIGRSVEWEEYYGFEQGAVAKSDVFARLLGSPLRQRELSLIYE
jgi:hypothetical protein